MGGETEIAILAGGCFWPMQELMRHRKGVISTRVGYTGGENSNPTADDHPGHAEAVEVAFDPEQTSYQDLVEFFLQAHRPDLDQSRVGFDYRSEIFYSSDEQRHVAEDAIADAQVAAMFPGRVVTKVSPAGRFWEAKAEDQDYLRSFPDRKNQFRRAGQDPNGANAASASTAPANDTLSWPEVAARLAAARSYWLCTTAPSGSPHSSPVWGVVVDEVLYFYSERRTLKARNLAADPRVVVHLDNADDVVIVRGTAEDLGTPAQVPEVVAGLSAKYTSPEDRQYLPESDPAFDVVYAVRPRSAMTWSLPDFDGSQRRWRA